MKTLKSVLVLVMLLSATVCKAQESNVKTDESDQMTEKAIAVFIAVPNPDEQEAMAYYFEKANVLFEEAGGKNIAQSAIKERLHGEVSAGLVGFSEFPSEDALRGFFESEEYKALLPYRDKAFKSLNIYIGN